jgi:hypothetical protein
MNEYSMSWFLFDPPSFHLGAVRVNVSIRPTSLSPSVLSVCSGRAVRFAINWCVGHFATTRLLTSIRLKWKMTLDHSL